MSASTQIIIVNYNAGNWLLRAIESALKFSSGDVTVVDNASTDDSVQQAQRRFDNPRLNWQLNTQNLGFAAANNQVLASVNSDYAVLMNPDCELDEDTLPPILLAMQADAKIGLAGGLILNQDGSIQATCRRRFPTPWSALVRLLQLHRLLPNSPRFANFDYGDLSQHAAGTHAVEYVEAISGAFMVARMSAVKHVGLLDEDYFMHCEDLDWCKRFQLSGFKVAFIAESTLIHAKGVSSQSRPIGVLVTLHKGMNRFFDKFYAEQTAWPIRASVKLGIVISFCARASVSLLRSWLSKS